MTARTGLSTALPRPTRVLAIAFRDLRIEFSGRRAWMLPFIGVSLLLPGAIAPPAPQFEPPATLRVAGPPPPMLAGTEGVTFHAGRGLSLEERPNEAHGRLIVHGDFMTPTFGHALDAAYPPIQTEVQTRIDFSWPERSLFLSLVAASLLTGAISQSLPGERSARTMETLLTAGITRAELVAGKWLAWGGLGGLAGLLACLLAVLGGHQTAGWYLLPVPWVAGSTAALGFWLVRRANDVIGGATVAIRVLPATLFISAGAAWWIGTFNPLLGACVPLGGALVAAGAVWDGFLPPFVATLVTGALTLACLAETTRDLAEGEAIGRDTDRATGWMYAAFVLAGWWFAVASPVLWSWGGNPDLAATLPATDGATSGAILMFVLLLVALARSTNLRHELQIRPTTPWQWAEAMGAGVLCLTLLLLPTEPPWDGHALTAAGRFAEATRVAPYVTMAAMLAAEVVLRGAVRARAGLGLSTAVAAVLLTPLNPIPGLVCAVTMTALQVRHQTFWPALLVRGVCLLPILGSLGL